MTLVTIEGFEGRSSRMGWTHANFSTAGRFGGICAHTGAMSYTSPVLLNEAVIGFALKVPTGNNDAFLSMRSQGLPGDWALALYLRIDGRIAIHKHDSSSTIKAIPLTVSSASVGDPAQWVYLEARVRIASVGGYVDVYVNGQSLVSYVGNTLPNVADPAYPAITRFDWASTSNVNIDDVYISDRSGSEFNDFIGEIQVEGLFPNGNGSSSQLVGSDGNSVDNYLLVDEAPAVETDLVSSDVVGAKDTYQFTNPVMASGQILAVQPSAAISKLNAGPAKMKLVERLASGTERKSVAFHATNLQSFSELPKTRDPEGSVWTPASVSSSEFGVEVA